MQSSILNVKCEHGQHVDSLWNFNRSYCEYGKQLLLNYSTYVQLKTQLDYQRLSERLHMSTQNSIHSVESVRIYYLSISPSLYSDTVYAIHHVGRPKTEGTQMRVVFEKPFGKVRHSIMLSYLYVQVYVAYILCLCYSLYLYHIYRVINLPRS